jgi:uncharacterized protein
MNNTSGSQEPIQPWYKQFWAWFILAPLIIVIIACAITVSIAFKNKDDIVIDNYYKEGRMINQRFEQDSTAREMGLSGELMFDREVGEVFLTLQSDVVLPEKLVLELSHPQKAEYDQQLTLKKVSEGRYRADLDARLQHHWYVRILPLSEAEIVEAPWRLKGEIDFKFGERVNFDSQELSP